MNPNTDPLFQPLSLKHHTLKNRFIMGSMHTGLEDDLKHIPELTQYFVERAKGGVSLIVTGGYSPNWLGKLSPLGASFRSKKFIKAHQPLTRAVKDHGATICLQLLHAGRYSFHPFLVAPSRKKSPITPFTPFALPTFLVKSTVQDFAKAARAAMDAGYDGVEVMGSEGYLIHQFFSERTNQRTDRYGGCLENRMRFALEIVEAIRKLCGDSFLILFRISILDLVEKGANREEVYTFARALEKAGVDLLNSGIGWHEARIPTIGSMVPRGAFRKVTRDLKSQVQIPVIACNRINTPDIARDIIESGDADLVSMARPFLADPHFVKKTQTGNSHLINTCIACNQACLDHVFQNKRASCLVNPKACFETQGFDEKSKHPKKVAIIGAGPAGLSAAIHLLEQGHTVTVFEKSKVIGGQFLLAANIPGKEDYFESIRYWQNQIHHLGGEIKTHHPIESLSQLTKDFDHVVFSTGVIPRKLQIEGADLPHVFPYDEVLKQKMTFAGRGVIIGAGGIGIDVANYLLNAAQSPHNTETYYDSWGIDPMSKGGLSSSTKKHISPLTSLTLLQRKKTALGKTLGKTTGWIHRLELKKHQVNYQCGLEYERITPEGVWVRFEGKTESTLIPADFVVICAGQVSENKLVQEAKSLQVPHSEIGGALLASEVDAKRAIREAFEIKIN